MTKKPRIQIGTDVPEYELRRSPRISRRVSIEKWEPPSALTIEPTEVKQDQASALLYDLYRLSRENTPRNNRDTPSSRKGLGIMVPSPSRGTVDQPSFSFPNDQLTPSYAMLSPTGHLFTPTNCIGTPNYTAQGVFSFPDDDSTFNSFSWQEPTDPKFRLPPLSKPPISPMNDIDKDFLSPISPSYRKGSNHFTFK